MTNQPTQAQANHLQTPTIVSRKYSYSSEDYTLGIKSTCMSEKLFVIGSFKL